MKGERSQAGLPRPKGKPMAKALQKATRIMIIIYEENNEYLETFR